MKIAHAVDTFPPYSRGGAENYVEALAREQLHGNEVIVFHRIADPDRPEYELRDGLCGAIPVVTINRTFRDLASFRETYESEDVTRAFDAFLEAQRPDLVHFHHVACLSTTCIAAARRRGIPVVFTLHDFWPLCPRSQLVRRDQSLCESHEDADCVQCMAPQLRLDGSRPGARRVLKQLGERLPLRAPKDLYRRWRARPLEAAAGSEQIALRSERVLAMFEQVSRCISPSAFLRDRFVAFGVPAGKIELLDNGFDRRLFLGMNQGMGQGTDGSESPQAESEPRLRVAYLGAWIPTKGVHLLLEAFRELDPDRARLDVHGYALPYEGHEDYEQQLRDLAEGLPHVRLGQRYAPEDVPTLLEGVDVLVAPSTWYENSPLSVHEAFLAGAVVVASNHGGLRELVEHEVNGLTFEPGSAASLGAALQRLIDDPDLLERLRRHETPVMEIAEHALALEGIYAAVLADPGDA